MAASAATAVERQTLSGHVPPAAARLQSAGRLPANTRLKLAISLPLRNQDTLTNLLRQICAPGDPNFRHYLAPAQFTEQFGPAAQDYEAALQFARAGGLTITATHSNRMIFDVEGSVADIEKALHVNLLLYPHPKESRQFYAPDAEPSLDLATPVLHISGLDNYRTPRPAGLRRARVDPARAAVPRGGSGPDGSFLGNDFRKAYLPGLSLTGAGQMVGLFELDGYYPADIASYEKQAGLAAVPLKNILIDGFNGVPSGTSPGSGDEEVALDIEATIAMAPGLAGVLVYEADPSATTANIDDLLNRMATDNLAKQFNCSWGFDIDPATEQIFAEYALQGQSFILASGDTGAFTPVVVQPSDNPYITVVGGTTLTTDTSGAWASEVAWSDTESQLASSGGISTVFPIPYWQQGISMTASHGSTTMRNVPDVAMLAYNDWEWADDGQSFASEGTSVASPLWAAFIALVNEQAAAHGQPPVGFVNPALYALAKGPDYQQLFHDITSGTNPNYTIPNPDFYFTAVPGYDLVTGWGSPQGLNLLNALLALPTEPLVVRPLVGFTASGTAGGPFNVASETFVLTNTGATALHWSLVNTSAWLSVSSSAGLLPANGAASVQVSLNAAATNLILGNYFANIPVTDLADGVAQVVPFTVLQGNSGFETGDFTDWDLQADPDYNAVDSLDSNQFYGSDLVPGIDDSLFVHSGIYGAALGQAGSLGTLSQTLPTVSGRRYIFSFWLDNPLAGNPNEFTASWNGSTLFTQSDLGHFAWRYFQYVVTATSSSSVIQIGFRNDQNAFGLDDVVVQVVPPPQIQSITLANGTINLVWSATPSLVYQPQYTDNLPSGAWTTLGPALTASSSTLSASDKVVPSTARFYRVLLAP